MSFSPPIECPKHLGRDRRRDRRGDELEVVGVAQERHEVDVADDAAPRRAPLVGADGGHRRRAARRREVGDVLVGEPGGETWRAHERRTTGDDHAALRVVGGRELELLPCVPLRRLATLVEVTGLVAAWADQHRPVPCAVDTRARERDLQASATRPRRRVLGLGEVVEQPVRGLTVEDLGQGDAAGGQEMGEASLLRRCVGRQLEVTVEQRRRRRRAHRLGLLRRPHVGDDRLGPAGDGRVVNRVPRFGRHLDPDLVGMDGEVVTDRHVGGGDRGQRALGGEPGAGVEPERGGRVGRGAGAVGARPARGQEAALRAEVGTRERRSDDAREGDVERVEGSVGPDRVGAVRLRVVRDGPDHFVRERHRGKVVERDAVGEAEMAGVGGGIAPLPGGRAVGSGRRPERDVEVGGAAGQQRANRRCHVGAASGVHVERQRVLERRSRGGRAGECHRAPGPACPAHHHDVDGFEPARARAELHVVADGRGRGRLEPEAGVARRLDRPDHVVDRGRPARRGGDGGRRRRNAHTAPASTATPSTRRPRVE